MLKIVYNNDDFQILKYFPTIRKPFYVNMEPLTLAKRMRFAIDLFYGYRVYYLLMKESKAIVSYCTVTNGKNPRYWFANGSDVIIGPYYTDPLYRGKGYAGKLVEQIVTKIEINRKKAYAYIWKTKVASIRIMEHVGGQHIFNVHNTWLHRLKKSSDGEYAVYVID